MEKKIFTVSGMKCCHCEMKVEDAIKAVEGVVEAKADCEENNVTVEYDESQVSVDDIKSAVEDAGNYEVEI